MSPLFCDTVSHYLGLWPLWDTLSLDNASWQQSDLIIYTPRIRTNIAYSSKPHLSTQNWYHLVCPYHLKFTRPALLEWWTGHDSLVLVQHVFLETRFCVFQFTPRIYIDMLHCMFLADTLEMVAFLEEILCWNLRLIVVSSCSISME